MTHHAAEMASDVAQVRQKHGTLFALHFAMAGIKAELESADGAGLSSAECRDLLNAIRAVDALGWEETK